MADRLLMTGVGVILALCGAYWVGTQNPDPEAMARCAMDEICRAKANAAADRLVDEMRRRK